MITEQKILDICARLLEKSKKNEVNWVGMDAQYGTCYRINFSKSHLDITLFSPQTEEDFVEVEIVDNSRRTVGSLKKEKGADGWQLLKDLFDEANRSVTGWDQVLDEIEKETQAEGTIGTPPEPEPPHPTISGDQDIPF